MLSLASEPVKELIFLVLFSAIFEQVCGQISKCIVHVHAGILVISLSACQVC